MFQKIDQSKLSIPGENSLSIQGIRRGSYNSHIVRNILVERGYKKFDGSKLKGDFCYDSYFKDFINSEKVKYTIYLYCYDLKEIVDEPELLEFGLECQIESEKGIIGLESVQWNFINLNEVKSNIEYFEKKIDEIWKILGNKNFPS